MNPSDITDKMRAMLPRDAKKVLGVYGMTLEEVLSKQQIKTERDLHRQIEQFLNSKGIAYRHDRMDKRTTGTVGWPDFTFAWWGSYSGVPVPVPVAVEAKAPGGIRSPDQEALHIKMINNGWHVIVAYSFTQFIEELKGVR